MCRHSLRSLQNPQSTLADLASMLLSNMTSSASICAALLTLNVSVLPDEKASSSYYAVDSRSGTCMPPHPYPSGEPKSVSGLSLLVDAFSKSAVPEGSDKPQPKAKLHFLSSVFANVSAVSIENLCVCGFCMYDMADSDRSTVFRDTATNQPVESG